MATVCSYCTPSFHPMYGQSSHPHPKSQPRAALREDGLNGYDHTFGKHHSCPAFSIRQYIRRLVDILPYAMADQRFDDSVSVQSCRSFNRASNVSKRIAGNCLCDRSIECFFRAFHKPANGSARFIYPICPGRVSKPAVFVHHHINRYNISTRKWPTAGKTVTDYFVNGRTCRVRIVLIPFCSGVAP